ncbi:MULTISPECIES: OmpA family protein [unclassified Leisingera]|uniref:OmpA family protein n=1 Tax=unclassified Leisingera TaxID=2614906 RepID=UPI00031F54A1|nr:MULTISPECIES: OmpA family protein [unclassified Leisingera]KIC16034.1 membrane protein [Leisingera sp. ANG-DT]KIC26173.1 membrane protein [Leisingera sp. ANG-S3]KIC30791.1 membrane protein [Leisingera sp. ANG-M6]KIC30867.1 membrane protein [Leisingera sp. ANG-S5]KIC55021.1 membrane protein [Leisingera sp. ANG-S]
MIRTAAILGLFLTAAACEREAGQELNRRATFGESTLNNSAVMSGERSYAIQLANRFAKEVPNTINFDFDSTRLDQAARAVLDRQAHWIKQFPEVRFRVFGHTDAVGSNAYNKSLGLRRARAAVNYLVSRGISRNRLEAVVSFGETQPLIPTPERERRNRRTVTEVSGFLKRHPQVLDGKYAQIIYREYLESAVPESTLSSQQSLSRSLQ